MDSRNCCFSRCTGLIDWAAGVQHMGVETNQAVMTPRGWAGIERGRGRASMGIWRQASGDADLRELAAHIESPLFIAHVRATTGTAIQQTNCHPFAMAGG